MSQGLSWLVLISIKDYCAILLGAINFYCRIIIIIIIVVVVVVKTDAWLSRYTTLSRLIEKSHKVNVIGLC